MKRRDLVRSFYKMVLIKERERQGYATPGKRWSNGEPTFPDTLIEDVVDISINLADQFIKIEKKFAIEDWMNEEI